MKKSRPESGLARPATFWTGAGLIALAAALSFREAEATDLLGFAMIAASALLPVALWCRGRAQSLPLFPVFTLGTIATFALPLIAQHPLVLAYSPGERAWAALTVAATNLAGTVPWWVVTRRLPPRRRAWLELRPRLGLSAWNAVLALTTAFDLGQLALSDYVSAPAFSIIRAGIIALSNLAIFLAAHRLGLGRLPAVDRLLAAALIVAVIVSTLPSGMMVGALSYGLMALIGYALCRGRLPWLSLGVLALAALFLQAGKEDLRAKYWFSPGAAPLRLADYPDMLGDWVLLSFAQLTQPPTTAVTGGDAEPSSLVVRASLLQLLLRIQNQSPDPVPYLHGRTYAIIPQLLVPRAFDADKKRAHLGTYLLAMHYGLQSDDDTLTTTIGFGLINEAMANFGRAGCIALGAGLGLFYGAVARWSAGYPLTSFRSLAAILVLSVAFQNEFSAGVYVTTLFQGGCVILALAPLILRRTAAAPALMPPALAGAPA